ncbi:hypothetical protein ACFSHR_26690 [Azotobacter chroococcum]
MKTAKELGVTQPAVSQWLSGACRMSAAIAFRAQEKPAELSRPGSSALTSQDQRLHNHDDDIKPRAGSKGTRV